MKYSNLNIEIPQNVRKDLNSNILLLIDSADTQGVSKEEIFNTYTGIGGLHDLTFSEFDNRHQYTEAKKEIEQGQFFTPVDVAQRMAEFIDLRPNETIADLTAGHGVFTNFFPEENFYGCEIDEKAHKVCKFLYPKCHIELVDIRYYQPEVNFDFVIGNPPFNLKWEIDKDTYSSQVYYFKKAAQLMRPTGLLLAIVPASYYNDDFFNKSEIEAIRKDFRVLFQIQLPAAAFKSLGVQNFSTKIICLQKKSDHLDDIITGTQDFISWEDAKNLFKAYADKARKIRIKVNAEHMDSKSEIKNKVRKYLYEIKTHSILREYYVPAREYVSKYINQKCPDNMKRDEWEKKHRITDKQILSYLKRTVQKQSIHEVNKIALVKTTYGLKYKGYSAKTKKQINDDFKMKFPLTFNNVVYTDVNINNKPLLNNNYIKLINKKKAAYKLQATPFAELPADPKVDKFLSEFYWLHNNTVCQLNDKQKIDLAKIFQKRYAILNWQQGSGKTPAGYAWSKFIAAKKTFVVSTALSVTLTWQNFLKGNHEPYLLINSWKDFSKVDNIKYILISHDFMIRYERQVQNLIKRLSNKVALILDESDEITNHNSKRTRATVKCFRKAKHKLLTTGTTTRNNISELYSQLELLYNNSIMMPCEPKHIYVEDKKTKDISKILNDKTGQPFPAYYGNSLFKKCFNPSKTSVFGINKQNQNLYNENELRRIIQYTIITRKFKDLAGDKYKIINEAVFQNTQERLVYRTIIKDFHKIVNIYFTSTGSDRKDAMLKLIRQIQLLIKATSTPQYFSEYSSKAAPNKALHIFKKLEEINQNHENSKTCIGTTTIEALEYYADEIGRRYPGRPVFIIKGDVNFTKRGGIIEQFEATTNGILICTQQSLKSSVNIPECNHCIIESLQWNIPKIEQFYFRFIRYNSTGMTKIYFVCYHDTIEANLLALLMSKEKLNDFIKTLEYRDDSDIYNEFDIDPSILNMIITKDKDEDGKMQLTWGAASAVA